jgi:hypothetical protein
VPAVLALATVHDALVSRIRAVFNGLLVDSGPSGMRSAVTVYDGVAVERPAYPYLVVGGSSTEEPYNTLGGATGTFGATVTIPMRVVTQYPMTEGQTYRVLNMVKGAIERQTLIVPGFVSVDVEITGATLLSDVINGLVTRELVAPVDVFVHQS